ncbi:MAG: hypothetical protein ACRYGK_02735 [Janthinobacterium lividum]
MKNLLIGESLMDDDLGQDLARIEPKTIVGKIRKYMPLIDQKMSEGVSAQDMLEVLSKHGIDLNISTFRYYVHQYRKQKKSSGEVSSNTLPRKTKIEKNIAEKNLPETAPPQKREPLSVQDLHKVMNQDPLTFEKEVEESERRYKEHLKNTGKTK